MVASISQQQLRVDLLIESSLIEWSLIGEGAGIPYEDQFAVASFVEVFAILRVGAEIGYLDREYLNTQFREQAHRIKARYAEFRVRWSHLHQPNVLLNVENAINGKPLLDEKRISRCESLFPLYQSACVKIMGFNHLSAAKRLSTAWVFLGGSAWDNLLSSHIHERDVIAVFDSDDLRVPLNKATCLSGFFQAIEHMANLVDLLGRAARTPGAPAERRKLVCRELVRAHSWRLNLRSPVVAQRAAQFTEIASEKLASDLRASNTEAAAFRAEVDNVLESWSSTLSFAGVRHIAPRNTWMTA